MSGRSGGGFHRKEYHPEFFTNSLKINTLNLDCTRSEVVSSVKSIVSIDKIKCLGQYKGKNNWVISFKNDVDINLYVGQIVKIKDSEFRLDHVVSQSIFKCFKVVWLPPGFNKIDDIGQKLCGQIGKVKSIKQVADKDGILMNIFNITIEYPANSNIDLGHLTGKKVLYGETMFITCYGDPIRCIYCSEFGHKKAECKKFKQICDDCGKRGHSKCTMATKINNANEEEIDYEDSENSAETATIIANEMSNNFVKNALPTADQIIKVVTNNIQTKSTPILLKSNLKPKTPETSSNKIEESKKKKSTKKLEKITSTTVIQSVKTQETPKKILKRIHSSSGINDLERKKTIKIHDEHGKKNNEESEDEEEKSILEYSSDDEKNSRIEDKMDESNSSNINPFIQ